MKQKVQFFLVTLLIFSPLLSIHAQEFTSETPTISNGAQAYILSQQMEMRGAFENVTPGPESMLNEPDAPGSFIQACTFDTNAVYNGSYYIPPDNHAAAGNNYVVNVVNALIQIFTKSGTLQYTDDIKGFCTSNGFTPLTATFDPKILYDQYSDRWVFVTLEYTDISGGGSANTSSVIMGCSQTSDPTGSWYIDTINTKINISGTDSWLDYPGFAVDEEAIYVTGNMFAFAASGGAYQGQRTIIINKTIFYSTGFLNYNIYDPETLTGAGYGLTYMPAHTYGTLPSGVGTFFVGFNGLTDGTNEYLNVIRVDNPLTTPSWSQAFVSMGNIDPLTGNLTDAPQSGTGVTIETNDRRTLDAVWQNNSLYIVTTIEEVSSQTAAYWAEINTSNLSSLVFSDGGVINGEDIAVGAHTFFPSIAVDPYGNIGVGFSASASTIYPGAYFTYRLAGDAAGTMRTSQVVKAGTDYYIRTFGGSRNRWGDYSGTAVDPVDGKIWVYNQYAMTRGTILSTEDGRWSTGYRYFYIAAPVSPLLSSPSNGATGITVPTTLTWSAAFGATSYTVEVSTNATFTNIVNSQSGLTSTSTSVPGLSGNTQYYWRVRAVNPEDSTNSNTWSFTTQGSAPPAPVLLSPSDGSIDESTSPMCTWNASTGATSYSIEVATDPFFINVVFTQSGIVGTSHQVGVLDGLTLYYWRVTAVNGGGSNTSSPWSFTTFDADVAINYTSGWNILTLPLPVQYNDPDSVFPSRTSQVYGYTSGYYVATALDPEVGYWAQFSSADSVIISGTDKAGPTVSVASGWNIIGGFDYAVTTASITSTPSGIIQSNFYSYSSGYSIASVLEVGKGYWVQCSQSGTLTLPTGTVPRNVQPFKPEEEWISVTISDNAGNSAALYITESGVDNVLPSLPPVPPAEIFDARFADDTFIGSGGMLAMQSSHYPLKISVSGGNLQFTGVSGGEILDKQLRDGESFTISSPAINRLNVNVVEIPVEYALFQNYPNPFNPGTKIKFALPEAGKVTLEVYDQLGQKVETLVNQEYDAGYHELEWNASQHSSGVYLYVLKSGNYKSVKKMLLLK